MAVAAAAAHPDVAAVDEHMRGRIAQHVETAVGKRRRPWQLGPRIRRASNAAAPSGPSSQNASSAKLPASRL